MLQIFILVTVFSLSSVAESNAKNKSEYWKRITGIPKFDPAKHSDGCSGGMSAGYAILPKKVHDKLGKTLPWRQCCIVHDHAYYYGGTRKEKTTADHALKQCVKKTIKGKISGEIMGEIMRLAVTPGGSPYWKTPWRWGYGEDYRLPAKD
ncbi:MAG: hypothetical protein VW455_02710 [Nitrospinota bacterium]